MNNSLKICVVGNMLTLPYSPDHAGVIQGLNYLKEQGRISDYQIVEPHDKHQESLANAIIETNPDLVIHGMTDSLSMIVPPLVKEKLPNTIQVFAMWDFRPKDMMYDGLWSKWKLSAGSLDLITLSNKEQLDWWAEEFKCPTKYWPHGCVVVDNLDIDESYKFDTVFVGSRNESYPYNERVKLIDSIDRLTPVKWINESGGDSTPARINVWKDLGKIYRSSKVTLDISHFWTSDGYCSGRSFYSSGLGGCAVTKRFPGCEELFPEGVKHYFDTPEEAADKIKWLLANPDVIEETKKKAWEYNKENHSYHKRFLQLFNWLNI